MNKISHIKHYTYRRGTHRFRANGKLLISGEYLVLLGATAFAIPTAYGQQLLIQRKYNDQPAVYWTSYVKGEKWIDVKFYGSDLEFDMEEASIQYNLKHIHRLRTILLAARELEPEFLSEDVLWTARADINFDREWGLGTSSTLIYNIASWIGIDPYKLLHKVSLGSGYDIACAKSVKPILYIFMGNENEPKLDYIDFKPSFLSRLFFVYSGNKQSTDESLQSFSFDLVNDRDISRISKLSRLMSKTHDFSRFMGAMTDHESIISQYTGIAPVKETLFPDFFGAVKSLGAWGGDFMLAASDQPESITIKYFQDKGYKIIIPFKDMLFNRFKHIPYAK